VAIGACLSTDLGDHSAPSWAWSASPSRSHHAQVPLCSPPCARTRSVVRWAGHVSGSGEWILCVTPTGSRTSPALLPEGGGAAPERMLRALYRDARRWLVDFPRVRKQLRPDESVPR
jgi:hypothetical protein